MTAILILQLLTLAAVLAVLLKNTNRKACTMSDLSGLESEVSSIGNVVDSAVALIAGLEAKLVDAGTDPAKLDDLRNQLAAKRQALAAAVATGTPAAPAPTSPDTGSAA